LSCNEGVERRVFDFETRAAAPSVCGASIETHDEYPKADAIIVLSGTNSGKKG